MNIACGMAAIPARYSHAEKTVRQFLADDRVTSFSLYCDSTEFVPTWAYSGDFDERLRIHSPPKSGQLVGDKGKLACANENADVYLLLDDDLDYPQNYLDRVAAECSEELPIITCHGVSFWNGWRGDGPYEQRNVLHFGNLVEERSAVDLGGTGVMAIHSSQLPLLSALRAAVTHPNMLDIHVACYAAWAGVPITCITHEAGWIKQGIQDNGIYERRNEDPLKNEISIALIKYLLRLKGKL